MKDEKRIDKKLLIRVLVLVIIVVGVTIIWTIKNKPDLSPNDKGNGSVADFALEASSVDLESLKKYNLPIIIDFGADSCIPCKEMAPVLQTLNAEMQGKAIIKFVDVWKNSTAANDFPVQVIPTQVIFDSDGKASMILKIMMGSLILLIGFYMFYLGF